MSRLSGLGMILALFLGACGRDQGLPESLAGEVAACDDGDMTACENAAGAFENGIGVEPDPERAGKLRNQLLTLAQKHCGQGQAHGCSYLGRIHLEGIGVPADRDKGIALLRRGCTGGDPLACTYLENLGISGSAAGIGPEPAAPTPDLFQEIERKSAEAERQLAEDLRNRPK